MRTFFKKYPCHRGLRDVARHQDHGRHTTIIRELKNSDPPKFITKILWKFIIPYFKN